MLLTASHATCSHAQCFHALHESHCTQRSSSLLSTPQHCTTTPRARVMLLPLPLLTVSFVRHAAGTVDVGGGGALLDEAAVGGAALFVRRRFEGAPIGADDGVDEEEDEADDMALDDGADAEVAVAVAVDATRPYRSMTVSNCV